MAKAVTGAGRARRRKRMPRERQSITHKFSIGGHEGYITAGMYEDGTVGEIFLTDIGKEGSTLRGMMNSFATAISIALQYGVPLETLVQKFAYMRFEPEGITHEPGDPVRQVDARLHHALARVALPRRRRRRRSSASSRPEVRARKTGAGHRAVATWSDTAGPPARGSHGGRGPPGARAPRPPAGPAAAAAAARDRHAAGRARPACVGLDLGPACNQCGGMMQRTGSCYTCSSCGNNTGCG